MYKKCICKRFFMQNQCIFGTFMQCKITPLHLSQYVTTVNVPSPLERQAIQPILHCRLLTVVAFHVKYPIMFGSQSLFFQLIFLLDTPKCFVRNTLG